MKKSFLFIATVLLLGGCAKSDLDKPESQTPSVTKSGKRVLTITVRFMR